MLVSAISNNRFAAANNCPNDKTVVKSKDNTDTTFNSLTPNSKKTESDLLAIYDAINRWKLFCHSQIEAGKFDIIA